MHIRIAHLLCHVLYGLSLSIPAFASTPAGDIAPYGNPDGQLNAADLIILQRFINGDLTPTSTEFVVADVAPLAAPDGNLNAADLLILNRAILGLVNLPPANLALYNEDFESYSAGQTSLNGGGNGFNWATAPVGGGGAVDVSNTNPINGLQSLRFFFAGNSVNNGSGSVPPNGGGTRAEQQFLFPATDLVRVSYQLAIPANYNHRQTNGPNNQLLVFAEDQNALTGGHSYSALELTTGSDTNRSDLELVYTRNGLTSIRQPLSTDFITQADHGTVMNLEVEVKLASGASVNDGYYKLWKNGALIAHLQQLNNYGGTGNLANQMSIGYLMGWSYSGYDTDTTFLIDNFELSILPAPSIGIPSDTTPPGLITDFAMAEGTSPNTQIMIGFSAANDNHAVYRYDLRNAADGSLIQANVTSGQNISGLAGDTTYDWFIRVVDTSGNTRDSNPASYTTRLMTENEAARFLAQSTFGTTFSDITQVKQLGFDGWIDQQFTLPVNPQMPQVKALAEAMCVDYIADISGPPFDVTEMLPYRDIKSHNPRHFIWWKEAVEAPDQLRQRVAFALSEIFVLNGVRALGTADYYDILLRNAFGNYRQLLEEVSLHPMMGEFLTFIRNQKTDPVKNIHPDENYAREILQLFSIGVHELNLDGTIVRDINTNLPVPTYGQLEVEAFARVFTGWKYAIPAGNTLDAFLTGVNGYLGPSHLPMVHNDNYHDMGEKELLDYPGAPFSILPAGQSAPVDLDQALDNIFHHPNVGPFISKLLIKRLVTSNPSPAYVARVATVFNDNGNAVRGDLGAVIRAILMDPEARTVGGGSGVNPAHYGKLREPLLRFTNLWRAFGVRNPTYTGAEYISPPHRQATLPCPLEGTGELYYVHPHGLTNFINVVGQAPLQSPTVFNFFLPGFVPPGNANQMARLTAPEFQLATIEYLRGAEGKINEQFVDFSGATNVTSTRPNLDEEQAWADDHNLLLNKLDTLFTSGSMSGGVRNILLNRLAALDVAYQNQINNGNATIDDMRNGKMRTVLLLLLNTRDYLIQK